VTKKLCPYCKTKLERTVGLGREYDALYCPKCKKTIPKNKVKWEM